MSFPVLVFVGTLSMVFSTLPPSYSPTAVPTKSSEEILTDRTFGHKVSSAEFGGVVAGILVAFLLAAVGGYFCCASKSTESESKYLEVTTKQAQV